MKNRLLAVIASLAVSCTLAACGSQSTVTPVVEPIDSEENIPSDDNSLDGMANPMMESDWDSIVKLTGCMATLPDNMENPAYYIINNELGEVQYTTNNGFTEMNFRVQKTDTFTDISGAYYEWDVTFDDPLLEFECKTMGIRNDEGDVHVCLWYDSSNKVMYCLQANATDLNGFDIYAVAYSIMQTDRPIDDYPSNELEERLNQTSFDSYDEIISKLEGSEAYALVNIYGYDGEVLLYSSDVYDNLDGNLATIAATPYTIKSNGKVTADSILSSQGTAYPISLDEKGLIYCLGHSQVEKSCYGDNGSADRGIMVMKYISAIAYDDNGDVTAVSGFYRDENNPSFDNNDGTDYSEDDVEALKAEYDIFMTSTKPISFTAVDGRTPQ